jgi:NADPH:quinone reductase-like Zn-dependent oxidoreductase
VGRLIVYLNHLRGNDRKNTDNGRRVDLLADKTYRAKPEQRRKQMAKLDGKVVVITGASSGIGEATAEALAAEGASVVVAARREERLSNLVERINGENGAKHSRSNAT